VAVTLSRNDAYWGTKGPFATAVFRAVPDAATRLPMSRPGPPTSRSRSIPTWPASSNPPAAGKRLMR